MLVIEPCGYSLALYAVQQYHYSHSLPINRLLTLGVWEGERHLLNEMCNFVGVIVFGWAVVKNVGAMYGIDNRLESCELLRVALSNHKAPTSQIVAKAVKVLRKIHPEVKLIVSFADTNQGHIGTIYQAMNWLYVGESNSSYIQLASGQIIHPRTVASRYGTRKQLPSGWRCIKQPCKHKYVLPLSNSIGIIQSLPYPKKPLNNLSNSLESEGIDS